MNTGDLRAFLILISVMRKWLLLIAVPCLLVLGCSRHQCGGSNEQCINLKQMASELEQFSDGPTFASDHLQMTMTVRYAAGNSVFHCRLRNKFWKPLALNRAALPWKAPIFLKGTLVTAGGYTTSIFAGVIGYIQGMPEPFFIAPDEVIEGDFEAKYLPKDALVDKPIPRDQDVLLIWSYYLSTYGETPPPAHATKEAEWPRQPTKLIGVTFVPREAMKELGRD